MTPRAAEAPALERRRLTVTGVVQGVGFRPFVARLAGELDLAGFVGNDSTGVFAEVEGPQDLLDEFAARLVVDAPPLAAIGDVAWRRLDVSGRSGFTIVESVAGGPSLDRVAIPPDVAVCDACLAEVLDPADRRYRYPFANCTDCGPRFTIIRDLPYDRPATTMSRFTMCDACRLEYERPSDRRYHAQPIACPKCGPRLGWHTTRSAARFTGTDGVIAACLRALADGRVVAVKGIGGFHLACDATDDAAVDLLRRRKGRGDKPFAVMVADVEAARTLAFVDDVEADALSSPRRPIVLLRRRVDAPVSAVVAPGTPLLGVMLPYSPLHHLLFRPVPGSDAPVPASIVLTSGNRSDEPICIDDEEASTRLAGLADAYLTHDRPIHVPCDDSVVRVVDGEVQPIRRSRGWAPLPIDLPVEVAPVLAVGGELKNTCCVASGRRAFVSQHLGDMENLETLDAFSRTVDGFERMYGISPTRVGVDRHPGYLTRRWAVEHCHGTPVVEVQHHHAHVAAVMAEHGLDGTEPVIGIAFDGTGYGIGDDGSPELWGGEVLLADYRGFRRVGHLRTLPLPGGDAAVRNPCRVAVAYLAAMGIGREAWIPAVAACDPIELGVVERQVERSLNLVPTTSMGRLFDALASLLGVRHRIGYEAQAAIELEALADRHLGTRPTLAFGVGADGVIDPEPVVRDTIEWLRDGGDAAGAAWAVHEAIADSVDRSAARALELHGIRPVVLTGGVFQNALLARLVRERLAAHGCAVLTHRRVPPNDGGLSLGQAVIAGVTAVERDRTQNHDCGGS